MNWLSKLERKFGRFAIHNLTLYLIAMYVIGYGISLFASNLFNMLTLEPEMIVGGQVWRVFTWLLIPPVDNIIFVVFMCLLYYSLGNQLERLWGAFRYNIYIFAGILLTVAGVFLLYLVQGSHMVGYGYYVSTYYINMSIFLAFATIYPEQELLLYGILPVKIKWLAWLDVAYLLYRALLGSVVLKVVILASLLNFLIFFLSTRAGKRSLLRRSMQRKQKAVKVRPRVVYENGAKHKCALCGRTELTNPELEFRFCSKCSGNREYCQEHLFTHTHVK